MKVSKNEASMKWTLGIRSVQGVLAKKLLLSILLFSFFVTLLVSAFILYSDYQDQLSSQDRNLEQLEAGYVGSVSYSLWNFSTEQLEAQLEGIMSFPNVIYVGVRSNNLDQQIGSAESSNITRKVKYDLTFLNDGELLKIGSLNIVIDQKYIYVSLIKKGITIVITQFFKTLAVSLFILFLINTIVTRHLIRMANWAKGLDISQPLILNRSENIKDEIGDVTRAINSLRIQHLTSLERVKRVQQQLEVANEELEHRVARRTEDLVEAIDVLKNTQTKLVESEKLASLGKLIAGVAHELNTPLGVCMTAQSYLNEVVLEIDRKVKSDSLTRSDFDDSVKVIIDAVSLLDANLTRSRSLISNFKKLAMNSSDQVSSKFSLTQLIKEIEEDLSLMLADQNIRLKLLYVKDIEIETFLEPLRMVIEQLIRNSLEHGFKSTSGFIYICVIEGDKCLYIDYRDDGVGIPVKLKKSMFDPFVTSERMKGQVGLGLHIVYNFISQILGGSITYLDSNAGTHFSIEIPMDINKHSESIKSLEDKI